ncbi:MAG TPA: hypothetical protein VGM56_21745 [Byssovorax sp.]|jgi:hypothetical protein
MPRHSRPRSRVDELSKCGAIELVNIVKVDDTHYRLEFRDDLELPSFVLEFDGNRICISSAFEKFGSGRSCCDEALRALVRFARGEAIELPIAMEMDGGPAPGR